MQERAELAARSSLISQYQRTVTLLEGERNMYVRVLLAEKGLEPDGKYQLDHTTGAITKIEPN